MNWKCRSVRWSGLDRNAEVLCICLSSCTAVAAGCQVLQSEKSHRFSLDVRRRNSVCLQSGPVNSVAQAWGGSQRSFIDFLVHRKSILF